MFNAYFTDYPLGSRAPETYHASGPGKIMLYNTQKCKNNISGSQQKKDCKTEKLISGFKFPGFHLYAQQRKSGNVLFFLSFSVFSDQNKNIKTACFLIS